MTQINYPILYSFRRCPYAMRSRMALILSGCQVELREVVLKHKPASLLAYSAKGTVPVLVLPDGQVIEQSVEIIDWALANSKSARLSPATPSQLALIEYNDHQFKTALDHYKYFDRFPEQSQSAYRAQGEVFLSQLEQILSQQPFLAGDQADYLDIAIFPFIRQFSHVDKAWFEQANYPKLQQWLNGFLTSDDFSLAMKKFPAWSEDDNGGGGVVIYPAY
ncbi:MAG: glutathione S-transferase [Gammaproteobacteria bacterium]|nr:glutathione S-transferase [Gammaproteobacteria bacterium]